MTLHAFLMNAMAYAGLLGRFATSRQLMDYARADHICYKCASPESFEEMRRTFESMSAWVYQAIIANRRIAYIKLKAPIDTSLGPIWYLELSDQKPNGSQEEGFDHIEVYPTDVSYNELVERLNKTDKVVKVERPHHTTHDIDIGGFLLRLSQEPLVEKIKREEMV